MNVELNVANPTDISELVALENICFNTDRLSTRHFRHLIRVNSAEIIIAKAQEKILGAVVTCFRKNSLKARIYSLAVHPDYRKQGIAQMLYDSFENKVRIRECHQALLEVRKDNPSAISFYLKNGYQSFGEYKNFYEDKADALRMRKDLFLP